MNALTLFVNTVVIWKYKIGFKTGQVRPVTRILCGGGANEAKVDQTTEMYFLLSDPFI